MTKPVRSSSRPTAAVDGVSGTGDRAAGTNAHQSNYSCVMTEGGSAGGRKCFGAEIGALGNQKNRLLDATESPSPESTILLTIGTRFRNTTGRSNSLVHASVIFLGKGEH